MRSLDAGKGLSIVWYSGAEDVPFVLTVSATVRSGGSAF